MFSVAYIFDYLPLEEWKINSRTSYIQERETDVGRFRVVCDRKIEGITIIKRGNNLDRQSKD